MTQTPSTLVRPNADDRWTFLRDVAVFQLKMVVDNLRDFALMPISLGAALIDLVSKGDREGALFYRVLQWGADSEKIIDVYSALDPPSSRDRETMARQGGEGVAGDTMDRGLPFNPDFTIDAVVARLERVVVRECEKGGTASTIKAAMDRAIDQLHNETSGARDKATGLVTRAADRIRGQKSEVSRQE